MTTRTSALRQMPPGVWALGLVSLLMDISSEMIHSLLPLFMVTSLGASALAVGLVEGLAESTALIVKVFSGALSDYVGRRKGLAVAGYGLGALTKPLFALAVENLISNSIQHAPRGTPIEVRIERGDSTIVVSVIDAGKAVPPELREYALSAESHTPKGRSGPTRYGRGLSLLAARAAAGACGATLSLHGEDGRSEMRLTVDTIAQEPTLVS